MTDAAAQSVFLPGLVSAAGLTGVAGLSGVSGVGRAAGAAAENGLAKGFQERMQAVLAAAQAAGELLPDAAQTASLLPAVAPAVQTTDAQVVPAATATGLPPRAAGNKLPESGKLLPPAAQLLQNLVPAKSTEPLSAASLAPARSDSIRPDAGPLTQVVSQSRAQFSAAPNNTLLRDFADQDLATDSSSSRIKQLPASAEQISIKGVVPQSAAVVSGAPGVGETARHLNLQRSSQQDVRGGLLSGDALSFRPTDADAPKVVEASTTRFVASQPIATSEGQPLHVGAHARSAEYFSLSPNAGISSDAVLRDFQSMLPLRPQMGAAGQSWSAGLGQRLLMMADNGVEVARLRLTPAHLGPLEIHVNVEDDRAQVWFGAQHGQTREALEAALPRLREMFAEQGLNLTRADVEDQSNAGNMARNGPDAQGNDTQGNNAQGDNAQGNNDSSLPITQVGVDLGSAELDRLSLLAHSSRGAGAFDVYV